jgi:hypothetical protein
MFIHLTSEGQTIGRFNGAVPHSLTSLRELKYGSAEYTSWPTRLHGVITCRITIWISAGMTISSGIPRHRKHIFSNQNKNTNKSRYNGCQRKTQKRCRYGNEVQHTAEYFVIKQIHWRVANGRNLRNFAPRTSRIQISKVTAMSVC